MLQMTGDGEQAIVTPWWPDQLNAEGQPPSAPSRQSDHRADGHRYQEGHGQVIDDGCKRLSVDLFDVADRVGPGQHGCSRGKQYVVVLEEGHEAPIERAARRLRGQVLAGRDPGAALNCPAHRRTEELAMLGQQVIVVVVNDDRSQNMERRYGAATIGMRPGSLWCCLQGRVPQSLADDARDWSDAKILGCGDAQGMGYVICPGIPTE